MFVVRGSEPDVYITFCDTPWWLCRVLRIRKTKFQVDFISFQLAKLPSFPLHLAYHFKRTLPHEFFFTHGSPLLSCRPAKLPCSVVCRPHICLAQSQHYSYKYITHPPSGTTPNSALSYLVRLIEQFDSMIKVPLPRQKYPPITDLSRVQGPTKSSVEECLTQSIAPLA